MALVETTKCRKGCKAKPEKMEELDRLICLRCGYSWYPFSDPESTRYAGMPGSELI